MAKIKILHIENQPYRIFGKCKNINYDKQKYDELDKSLLSKVVFAPKFAELKNYKKLKTGLTKLTNYLWTLMLLITIKNMLV
jgi:hypothetical protein